MFLKDKPDNDLNYDNDNSHPMHLGNALGAHTLDKKGNGTQSCESACCHVVLVPYCM